MTDYVKFYIEKVKNSLHFSVVVFSHFFDFFEDRPFKNTKMGKNLGFKKLKLLCII